MHILSTMLRLIIFYMVALVGVRLMGKREIRELSPFDLVVAIMIGELVVIPVHDRSISYVQGVVPIILLVLAEILLSVISMKSHRARAIINDTPTVLIKNGIILEHAMRSSRYTNDELLIELRLNGIRSPAEVEFAVLEPGGHISVIPKSQFRPVTPEDLGIETKYEGLPVHVVNDGEILHDGLTIAGITEEELLHRIQQEGFHTVGDVFFASLDSDGSLYISPKDGKEKMHINNDSNESRNSVPEGM